MLFYSQKRLIQCTQHQFKLLIRDALLCYFCQEDDDLVWFVCCMKHWENGFAWECHNCISKKTRQKALVKVYILLGSFILWAEDVTQLQVCLIWCCLVSIVNIFPAIFFPMVLQPSSSCLNRLIWIMLLISELLTYVWICMMLIDCIRNILAG